MESGGRHPEEPGTDATGEPPGDRRPSDSDRPGPVHAAPSAPDLDAIPLRDHPDEPDNWSTTDLMGQDRKRLVVGKTYGPTRTQQATVFGGALLVLIVLVVGGIIAVNKLDQPPDHAKVAAPWAQPHVKQTPAKLPQ